MRFRVGDWLVGGNSICRVRSLRQAESVRGGPQGGPQGGPRGAPEPPLLAAAVSQAAEVLGFDANNLPPLGEEIRVVGSEEEAKREREVRRHIKAAAAAAAAAIAAALVIGGGSAAAAELWASLLYVGLYE